MEKKKKKDVSNRQSLQRDPLCYNRITKVPVKIYALEGTCPEQENWSLGHLPRVEHVQQIYNVDGLKTSKVVLIFPEALQQLYFQEFYPGSGGIQTRHHNISFRRNILNQISKHGSVIKAG